MLVIALRRVSTFDTEVRADRGDNFSETLILANIYNEKSEGRYLPLNENKSISDGVLNMVLVENISLAKYVARLSAPSIIRKLKQ